MPLTRPMAQAHRLWWMGASHLVSMPSRTSLCFLVTAATWKCSSNENRGTGTSWGSPTVPVSWTVATTRTLSGWQAEFRIEYAKLGVTARVQKVIGLSLINAWTPGGDFYWPNGAFWANPDTWGHLTSSSEWGAFYWKPGPWQDYAPSGMPDFDQKQNGWFLPGPVSQPLWTHCGPVAAANSLWWFDSKFETQPITPPVTSDHYPLVKAYTPTLPILRDDHDPMNVDDPSTPWPPGGEFIEDLALYLRTDVLGSGTIITNLY